VLTGLRGGLVFGEVVAQDGDYYGPQVNLAARIVAHAAARADPRVGGGGRRARGATCVATRAVGEREARGFEDPVAVFAVLRSSDGREL
jgi:class 3 adenylate cyclase